MASQQTCQHTFGESICIPSMLRAPALEMTAGAAVTGNMPTFFVGLVDETYTDETWIHHRQQIQKLFNISDAVIAEIKIIQYGKFHNTEQFAKDVDQAVKIMNSLMPATTIRIVGLGNGTRTFVTDALAAFVKDWNVSPDQKHIQFITVGDSSDCHFLEFCKDLCLKQSCKTVQFYNIYDYNVLGYLDT